MKNPVIIFGAQGLGQVALDIFQSNNVVVYCFLDDNVTLHGKEISDVPIMGATDDDGFLKLIGKKCEVFIASDDNKYRKNHVNLLIEERKVMPVNAIHQNSIISKFAAIGHGNMVNAGVTINSNARVGNHCIFGCNTVLDFDSEIGDFVQIGAGTIINSGVVIGKEAFIGSGVTVVSGVKIGKKSRIGAGSVVVSDVEDGQTVFGNPAKPISKS
ncbi:MAG TPA: acetyltransferase [Cytophagaceae bacterium]|jgi:sugar O-acyltransferase (sialic acid O-acetyltransferase NeuD family)